MKIEIAIENGRSLKLRQTQQVDASLSSTTSTQPTTNDVISIYCSITVNHRLTGPGKMVKVHLLFVGNYNQNNAIDIPITTNSCYY